MYPSTESYLNSCICYIYYYFNYCSVGAPKRPSASRTSAGGRCGAIRSETSWAARSIAIFLAFLLKLPEPRGTGTAATWRRRSLMPHTASPSAFSSHASIFCYLMVFWKVFTAKSSDLNYLSYSAARWSNARRAMPANAGLTRISYSFIIEDAAMIFSIV